MNQLLQTLLRHQCDFWQDIAPNRDADGNASDTHTCLVFYVHQQLCLHLWRGHHLSSKIMLNERILLLEK